MKNLKMWLIGGSSVLLVILLGVFLVQGSQNKAISFEEQIKTANSDIEVQEKRRFDLIKNLVDCVKNYDKHESDTIKAVVDGRNAKDINIEQVTTILTATAEAYPQLKSDGNYKQLMNELSTTENLIAQHRNNYNQQVKEYNRYVKGFPHKQFLNILGYEVQNYNYLKYNAPSDAPQNLFGDK